MRHLVPDISVHDVTEARLRQSFLLATEPETAALTSCSWLARCRESSFPKPSPGGQSSLTQVGPTIQLYPSQPDDLVQLKELCENLLCGRTMCLRVIPASCPAHHCIRHLGLRFCSVPLPGETALENLMSVPWHERSFRMFGT